MFADPCLSWLVVSQCFAAIWLRFSTQTDDLGKFGFFWLGKVNIKLAFDLAEWISNSAEYDVWLSAGCNILGKWFPFLVQADILKKFGFWLWPKI